MARTKKETNAQAWKRALSEGRVLRFEREDGTFQLCGYPDHDMMRAKLAAGLPEGSEFSRMFPIGPDGREVVS